MYRGRRAGSFGYAAFSLYATKNMTTAEGGFVNTNDDRRRLAQSLPHQACASATTRDPGLQLPNDRHRGGYRLVQLDKLERNTARARRSRGVTTRP